MEDIICSGDKKVELTALANQNIIISSTIICRRRWEKSGPKEHGSHGD
jgi:hypothetical protein